MLILTKVVHNKNYQNARKYTASMQRRKKHENIKNFDFFRQPSRFFLQNGPICILSRRVTRFVFNNNCLLVSIIKTLFYRVDNLGLQTERAKQALNEASADKLVSFLKAVKKNCHSFDFKSDQRAEVTKNILYLMGSQQLN